MFINAPSLAYCDFLTMKEQTDAIVAGGASWFHIDIMDGNYLPNMLLTPKIVGELKTAYPQMVADVHLMVTNPGDYIEPMKKAGADNLSFHCDATRFSKRLLMAIREAGMNSGVVINPSQNVEVIKPFIMYCDLVVIMAVEPGFVGQPFLSDTYERIAKLNELRKAYNADFKIIVDGGIDIQKAVYCAKNGADGCTTGAFAVFQQDDGLKQACHRFQKSVEEGVSGI